MTPKDFFTSPEDKLDSIEHIITMRKSLFAGNAVLSLIPRRPLGRTPRNKKLTLKRWIELIVGWMGWLTSTCLGSNSLTL